MPSRRKRCGKENALSQSRSLSGSDEELCELPYAEGGAAKFALGVHGPLDSNLQAWLCLSGLTQCALVFFAAAIFFVLWLLLPPLPRSHPSFEAPINRAPLFLSLKLLGRESISYIPVENRFKNISRNPRGRDALSLTTTTTDGWTFIW
jgi:hypothetical protein